MKFIKMANPRKFDTIRYIHVPQAGMCLVWVSSAVGVQRAPHWTAPPLNAAQSPPPLETALYGAEEIMVHT